MKKMTGKHLLLCNVLVSLLFVVSADPVPFTISVPDTVLKDLKQRLGNARYPDSITLPDDETWSYGAPTSVVRDYVDYWQTKYDWRAQEAFLNSFDNFKINVDGLDIHYVHAKSKHVDAMPLLVVHGWPGSFLECLKAIPLFTDPVAHGGSESDAFHVVCPSLPGYGFSDHPKEPGFGVRKMADVLVKLMAKLGYSKYMTQGGDWGAIITPHVAGQDSEHVVGTHLNMLGTGPNGFLGNAKFLLSFVAPSLFLSPLEMKHVTLSLSHLWEHFGYFHLQATKPMTPGYALADSPVGLAAWIIDKFYDWSDVVDGKIAISKDEILTNIMIYWVTNTITSSMRLYKDNTAQLEEEKSPILELPVAVCQFHADLILLPRMLAEQTFKNIVSFEIKESGGHFALLESTQVLVDDVRKFKQTIQKQQAEQEKQTEL